MSKYSIDSTTLTNIGNAIRAKDGTSSPIVVSDFATRINAIPSGGGSDNFTQPYNCNIGLYNILLPTSFTECSNIRIPYEIWSQYNSITFNYAIYSERRISYGSMGSYVDLYVQMSKFYSSAIWTASTVSIYPGGPKEYILQDFSGIASDTYTINCSNRSIYEEGTDKYPDISIILDARRYNSADTSSNCGLRLGNFSGVKK